MGNKKSRILEIDNVEHLLQQCQHIATKSCQIYGQVHQVKFNGNQFFLGEARSHIPPSPHSLHYLAPPNLLIIPEFTLLEQTKVTNYSDLLDIMIGVSELCCEAGVVGMGRGRVAFAGKWGLVGEKPTNWPYQQVFANNNNGQISPGVYLSPQLVTSLSKQKQLPIHNPSKSDMFAFGILLLEMLFEQDLSKIFDYYNYEIRLEPLLQKLLALKENFGEQIYMIVLKMVEFEQEDRVSFEELLEILNTLRNDASSFQTHNTSNIREENQHGARRKEPISASNLSTTPITSRPYSNFSNNTQRTCQQQQHTQIQQQYHALNVPQHSRSPLNKNNNTSRRPSIIPSTHNSGLTSPNGYRNGVSPFRATMISQNVKTPERISKAGHINPAAKTRAHSPHNQNNIGTGIPYRELRLNSLLQGPNEKENSYHCRTPRNHPNTTNMVGGQPSTRRTGVSPLWRR